MKAGKREDSLFLIIQAVSFCLAATIRSSGTERDIPCDLFTMGAVAATKRDNIKEDLQ
jgi:hypothetical protein